ncbi:NAD-dependent epimerase/dehydratase family protein [Chloroflexota bacterium]
MKATTFLVSGVSGFLGYHVSRYLLAKGQIIKGIDIKAFNYPDVTGKITFLKGSILERSLLEKAMRGVDIVIHVAGALPRSSKRENVLVNVEGTRNILQAAYDTGVERVIYISSTEVYGIPKEQTVHENYPLEGINPYGKSKIEAERLCMSFREAGLCVPILRPQTFAGPMRLGVFQILCDWVKDGKNIPIIGNGNRKYQLLHINDLLEAIYLVATASHDKANDTYNVGATEFRTMQADLQALLDYAGFGKRVIPIPSWLVIPTLGVLEYLRLSPLHGWVYKTANMDHCVSVEKIQRMLDWSPRKSTAEVWIDTYRWYLEEYGDNRPIETGLSHRVAWKQGILGLVKIFF